MDCSAALVFRERANIDLLIEVPLEGRRTDGKSLVVAVELKIDAKEAPRQLEKYREYVMEHYPKDEWHHAFVFLTLRGDEPSAPNLPFWIPLALSDVLPRFDEVAEGWGRSDKAVGLYQDYAAMMRRHLLDDDEFARIAGLIWSKHGPTLDKLNEFRPDMQADILEWIIDKLPDVFDEVEEEIQLKLFQDTSSKRIIRIAVNQWLDLPGFTSGGDKWVKSQSVLLVELADWKEGRLRLAYVMGYGADDVRQRIYDGAIAQKELKIARRSSGNLPLHKHLSARDVQKTSAYLSALEADTSIEELGKKALHELKTFLIKTLPIYNMIVMAACQDGTDDQSD